MYKITLSFLVIFCLALAGCNSGSNGGSGLQTKTSQKKGPAPEIVAPTDKEDGSVTLPLFFDEIPTELSEDDVLRRIEVENATARQAVCNDGSPAIYYFRESKNDSDKWVVNFKGGGSCSNSADCAQRWQQGRYLMTSIPHKDYMTGVGILSSDPEINPDFHDYNHVYAYYCSSDNWHGDTVIQAGNRTFEARGWKILEAIYEDLPIDGASEILMTGTSAGVGAVKHNIDRVASWFPDADVKGVLDSGWTTNAAKRYLATLLLNEDSPAGREAVEKSEYFNFQYDESCKEKYPDNYAFACSIDLRMHDEIETPVFYYVDQYDSNKIGNLGIDDFDDPKQQEWLLDYMEFTRDSIASLEHVFSPAVGFHTALVTSRFYTVEIDGYSFAEVLANWYFDRNGPTRLVDDTYEGY